jgi:hypothetical protein
MVEWGTKLSLTRYRKLHRVVRVLASSGKTLGNMDKAVIEWGRTMAIPCFRQDNTGLFKAKYPN